MRGNFSYIGKREKSIKSAIQRSRMEFSVKEGLKSSQGVRQGVIKRKVVCSDVVTRR